MQTSPRMGISSLRSTTIKLRPRRPTSLASSRASAEDEPLFMASRPVRKHHRSLSPISNRAPRRKSRQSEPNATRGDGDPACENLAWDVINREILEWQAVCQTGRPSWWSPVSKWTQWGARSTWQEELRAIPPRRMKLDHFHRPEQRYDNKRHAVTDSYLLDDKNVQDLAHLIAVQLLGACFTLPPEQLSCYKSQAYNCFDTLDSNVAPDSRLISSLRMHTEARYSPSFGHQARDASPACRLQGSYDGSSPCRSRESSSSVQSPGIKIPRKTSQGQRIHRALHLTEGSTAECSMESHLSLREITGIFPAGTTAAGHRLKRSMNPYGKAEPLGVLERTTKSRPSMPVGFDAQLLHTSLLATDISHGHTVDDSQEDKDLGMAADSSSRSLQSAIRSQTHDIYIQPVKELVVKNWQRLRRQVGSSFGYGPRDPANRGSQITSSVSASSRSSPAEGSTVSPILSSDGKERRRQARERGDIHSGSMGGGSSCHNGPGFNAESGRASADHLGQSSRTLGIAEAIANALADSDLITAISSCFTPPNSRTSPSLPSPSITLNESLLSPSVGSSELLQPPPTFTTRRRSHHQQRKSILSEVCTPEDMEGERSALSAGGSPLASPSEEEPGSQVARRLPSQIPRLDMEEEVLITQSEVETEHHPGPDEIVVWERPSAKMRRPSIVRTSTSGTQIFRPSEDGVEVDGLPTGPPAETWDDQGQGHKKRERSFL